MKLSVFLDHILQAQEQTGKPLAELFAEVKSTGIDALEINLDYLLMHEELLSRIRLLPRPEAVIFLLPQSSNA